MIYNTEDIKKIIPHRNPFLLVDRIESIEEVDGKKTIVGIKCVSSNEPFFQGHFPQYNVMPGVLILEALAQTGAVYVLSLDEYKGKLAFFAGANNVKWRQQVTPGDVLTLKVTLESIRHGMGVAKGVAYVGDKIACQGDVTFAIR